MRGGPGYIVAAAFIGPGTVTTATLAGVEFGTALVWTLVFATGATMVLQEMSARLGLVTRRGLVDALLETSPRFGRSVAWGTGLGVVLGVVAFQAGNTTGAALGMAAVTGVAREVWVAAVAITAGGLLWLGRYRVVERVLVACVALMGLLFVSTAVLVRPDLGELIRGALVPTIPERSTVLVLALIGTTIVPYNLFLHAQVVQARWASVADLPAARRDLMLAIGLGGIVSAAVVVTASTALEGTTVESAADMAHQLVPTLGDWARVTFGLGFAVAGLTSAITAPLAAAYILGGLLGQSRMDHRVPRAIALVCVATGAALALTGLRPVRLIVFAQATNGLILPVVVCAMLWVLNDRNQMARYANNPLMNVVAAGVVGLCTLLAIRNVLAAD